MRNETRASDSAYDAGDRRRRGGGGDVVDVVADDDEFDYDSDEDDDDGGRRRGRASVSQSERGDRDDDGGGGASDTDGVGSRASLNGAGSASASASKPIGRRLFARWAADERSLLMWDEKSEYRRRCGVIVNHWTFQTLVVSCIVASSVVLAVVKPDRDGGGERAWVTAFTYATTAVFMIEAWMKIVQSGFAFGNGAYLKSNWNRLDFLLVVLSVIFVPIGGSQVVAVRLLRALHTFRVFARYRSGRLVMKTVARALPLLGDVVMFLLWFLILFSVSGVTMFGGQLTGRLYSTPPDRENDSSYVLPSGTAKEVCAQLVAEWLGDGSVGDEGTYPNEYNSTCRGSAMDSLVDDETWCCDSGVMPYDGFLSFQNVGRSAIVALNGMTIDGWNELLNPLSYAVGYPMAIIWFAFVVIMGGFFMMELFTSVICATLTQIGLRDGEDEGNGGEDEDEEGSDDGLPPSSDLAPDGGGADADEKTFELASDSGAARRWCFRVAENNGFNNAVICAILLNTLLMMTQHYGSSDTFVLTSDILEYIFLTFFAFEMSVKNVGYGVRNYWKSKENMVDGFIVLTGIISVAVASQGVSASFIRLLRIFRAFRTFRVIRNNHEFRKIIASAAMGLNDMWPFLVMWILFQVIFGIYGFQLFSGMGGLDDERLTFRNFLRSSLTLFVVATGEDSFIVAWSTMDATGNEYMVLYTIAWIFVSTVILSLVLGILIDSCSLVEIEQQALFEKEAEIELINAALERFEQEDKTQKSAMQIARRKLQTATFAIKALNSLKKKPEEVKINQFNAKELAGFNLFNARDEHKVTRQREEEQSESEEFDAKDRNEHVTASPRRKLARAKIQRLQKKAAEDVAAVRVFLDSIAFKYPSSGTVITVSEHALEEARLRLVPKIVEFQSHRISSLRESMRSESSGGKDSATEAKGGFASNPSSFKESFNESFGGPWAEALRKSIVKVKTQQVNQSGVIITKDGEMIPVFDESIPIEKVKSRIFNFVSHRMFENFILLLIIAGSVMLATETHTWPEAGSSVETIYSNIDIAFTSIFTLELALKVFALGLYEKPTAYTRSAFNILDGLVVITSLSSLAIGSSGGSSVRALRIMRILRPLRSIRRFPGLKLVVNTVIAAVPAVSYVCLLGLASMSIFALLGMELFMGKFWSCRVVENASDYTTQATCEAAGGQWRNSKWHFDNFGAALLSTFLLHAGDDWQEIMWVAMDVTGEGTGLKTDNSQAMALYFVITVALGNFFWLNLLVTALVDNFNKMASQDKMTFVTPAQRRWQQAILRASTQDTEAWRKVTPPPGESLWSRARLMAHWLAKPEKFANFMLAVVIANTIEMMAQTADMSSAEQTVHFTLSIMFTVIYTVEMILLLMAQGPKRYRENYWNWLDSFVVIVSIVQAIGQGAGASGAMDYLQLVRLLRLLKLVKAHRGLRSLFNTFIMSLPGVANVAALSSLAIFSYAIVGVSLFGDYTGPYEGGVLSEFSNFETFGTACSSLFAVYTGGWVGTFGEMYQTEACLRTEPPFLPESIIDCSHRAAAIPYFLSFVIISIFLLGNLFVAIILERFTVSSDEEGLYDAQEAVEIIKHTIQLRRLALIIKNKVVQSRQAGGALFGAPLAKVSTFAWLKGSMSRSDSPAMSPSRSMERGAYDEFAAPIELDSMTSDDITSTDTDEDADLRLRKDDDDDDDDDEGFEHQTAERFEKPQPNLHQEEAPVDVAIEVSEPEESEDSEPVVRETREFLTGNRFQAYEPRRSAAVSEYATSDDDDYAFKNRRRVTNPGTNTPVGTVSEYASSEAGLSETESRHTDWSEYTHTSADDASTIAPPPPMGSGYRFGGAESDRSHEAHRSDFLYDYREDDRTREGVSSLLGSDDGATGRLTDESSESEDADFADISLRL